MRRLSTLCAFVLLAAGTAVAEIADRGPPYSSDDFLALSAERVPDAFKTTLPEWWAKAPAYLRKRILAAPSRMWWAIILCNYQGFDPNSNGPDSAETCEKNWYKASQRGKSFWTADGQFVGPSEACIERDKRTQYGELVCD